MSAATAIQARLAEAQLEKELETAIGNIARNLYGPTGDYERFGVVTCTCTVPPNGVTVYRAKCVGYRERVGGGWELCKQSIETHDSAWEALEELLRTMRCDLWEATKEFTPGGKQFRGKGAEKS